MDMIYCLLFSQEPQCRAKMCMLVFCTLNPMHDSLPSFSKGRSTYRKQHWDFNKG